MAKTQTSIRMSSDAKRLIALMAKKLGISQAAVFELAIRSMAKQNEVQ